MLAPRGMDAIIEEKRPAPRGKGPGRGQRTGHAGREGFMMDELMELLKARPTMYLATVEGYCPRVRPVNHYMIYKGYFYLALCKDKEAYKQLLDNTNLELCVATGEETFLRIQGTVNFDRSRDLRGGVRGHARPERGLQGRQRQASGPDLSGPHQRGALRPAGRRQGTGKVLIVTYKYAAQSARGGQNPRGRFCMPSRPPLFATKQRRIFYAKWLICRLLKK